MFSKKGEQFSIFNEKTLKQPPADLEKGAGGVPLTVPSRNGRIADLAGS
ncbi:hypothetical protein HMPREF0542_10625 [Ligilactobacillus ruminis ATCC 25644]|uniref:Uncharacterized protein n=1 Tax=Ligilactobacillus ruminis ATCC 25644 TaxID=525362 RepID=E7FNZ8_9LACO|nr:hypothetical protein HMPREF0542_10625 [Ligilactobacillus ruminis ATCC 25644]